MASYSSFWLGKDYKIDADRDSVEFVRQMNHIRNAIANFVKIATGKDIPVHFSSGKTSYTTGETIVISATDDPEKIDVQVGLALHEAGHINLSGQIMKFMHFLFTPTGSNNPLLCFEKLLKKFPDIFKNATRIQLDNMKVAELFKDVINIIEDRRIDEWMYSKNSGYRPYYEKLYSEFFYSKDVQDYLLYSPIAKFPCINNYLMAIIHATNPDMELDLDMLPGLREIVSIIDLKNIFRYGEEYDQNLKYITHNTVADISKTPLMFQDAVKIFDIILKYSESIFPPNDGSGEDEKKSHDGARDLPNYDQMSPSDMKKLLEEMEKQLQFVRGNHNGQNQEKLSSVEQSMMDALESGGDLKEIVPHDSKGHPIGRGGKIKVAVYKNVNESFKNRGVFPFESSYYTNESAVTDGMRIGSILANRVSILRDPKVVHYTRKEHGRLDKKLLAGLGYGNTSVFYTNAEESLKPVHVHMSIDASGSMHGEKFKNALTLAVALAYLADKNKSMNVVVDMRDATLELVRVAIIYDSRTDSFVKIRKLFPHLSPSGGTPEGLAFEAILKEIMENSNEQRKFFINFSDGQPSLQTKSFAYGGEPAAKHTAFQIKQIRETGVKVLSYFIGEYCGQEDKNIFTMMYGKDAVFLNDPESIPELTRVYTKLFLER